MEEKDSRIVTMEKEKPMIAILKMGIPVTAGMMLMVVYNMVDTYFIGRLNDKYQLAATSLAYPIMMIMVALAGIVGNGGASYIARCIGEKDMEKANHTLTVCFELIVIESVLITVLGLILINPIVHMLGAEGQTFEYTKQYVLVLFVGTIFTMGNYALGQLLRSEGSAMYSMIGMLAGTVANIVLDPIFIVRLGYGVYGAAVATIIGNALGCIISLVFYVVKASLLTPSVRYLRLDGGIVREIMWVGIPHTLDMFLSTAAVIVNNNLASSYGATSVAAMGVADKIISFGDYIYQGFTAGCQPLMGYNYGANNFKRLKELVKDGVKLISGIEIFVMLIVWIVAKPLIGIFTPSEQVIETGAKVLRAYVLSLPFVASSAMVRNTYNAMGKPLYALWVTIVRQILLYVPLLLALNYAFGFNGLVFAKAGKEAICMIFSLTLIFSTLSKAEMSENK